MPTRSEETRSAECGVRNEKPRSVFGNFAAPDGRAALSPARRDETLDIQDSPANSRRGEDTAALPLTVRGVEPLQRSIDIAVARLFLHRFITQLFEYPTAETWAWLCDPNTAQAMSFAAAALDLGTQAEKLLSVVRISSYESFLDAHLAAFGHAARGPIPMNEIEYGDLKADPLLQPHRLADLAAFYRAFGLEVAADASERQDHICLQLEFMSVLAAKEAFALEHQFDEESLAIGRAAQKDFLREHLGRWMPAFTRRVESATSEPILKSAAQFAHAFVLAECARFGIKPGGEDLVLRPVDEDDEQLCASCGLRDLPPGALTST